SFAATNEIKLAIDDRSSRASRYRLGSRRSSRHFPCLRSINLQHGNWISLRRAKAARDIVSAIDEHNRWVLASLGPRRYFPPAVATRIVGVNAFYIAKAIISPYRIDCACIGIARARIARESLREIRDIVPW